MLTVTRRTYTGVWVQCQCTEPWRIDVKETRQNQVRLGFAAPRSVVILRDEVAGRIPVEDEEFEPAHADISECDRCGGDHANTVILEFKNASPGQTHYYYCPKHNEPAFLEI